MKIDLTWILFSAIILALILVFIYPIISIILLIICTIIIIARIEKIKNNK